MGISNIGLNAGSILPLRDIEFAKCYVTGHLHTKIAAYAEK